MAATATVYNPYNGPHQLSVFAYLRVSKTVNHFTIILPRGRHFRFPPIIIKISKNIFIASILSKSRYSPTIANWIAFNTKRPPYTCDWTKLVFSYRQKHKNENRQNKIKKKKIIFKKEL